MSLKYEPSSEPLHISKTNLKQVDEVPVRRAFIDEAHMRQPASDSTPEPGSVFSPRTPLAGPLPSEEGTT